MQGLPPDLVVQSVLDGTAVDPDLRTAGRHVGPVIEGVFLAAADASVAAADGHRPAAQIGLHRGQFRHLAVPPVGLQRPGDLPAVGSAVLVNSGEEDDERLVPQQVGVGVAQGLPQVGRHLPKGGLLLFGGGLEGQELVHGAAHPHHRSGPACHFPAAGDHRHGHVDVVGAFRPLVAVVGHVFCRPGLDAPMLILPGVDGRQGVLQAHAVLVQSGFGTGAGGNGEGGVHVLDAGAVVPDRDIHIIPLLLQHDLYPATPLMGAEIGDGVVDQLAEGLAEVLEVAGNAGEKLLAVWGVVDVSNDDLAHNSSSKKCFFENKTHGAGRCPTSCGRILQHSSCPARRKRVYCPYRCGESRCVGGRITCAGAKELQLLCTAVFFTFYEQYSISV